MRFQRSQRRKACADTAKGRYLLAGSHLPFPRTEDKGTVWAPPTYNTVR